MANRRPRQALRSAVVPCAPCLFFPSKPSPRFSDAQVSGARHGSRATWQSNPQTEGHTRARPWGKRLHQHQHWLTKEQTRQSHSATLSAIQPDGPAGARCVASRFLPSCIPYMVCLNSAGCQAKTDSELANQCPEGAQRSAGLSNLSSSRNSLAVTQDSLTCEGQRRA